MIDRDVFRKKKTNGFIEKPFVSGNAQALSRHYAAYGILKVMRQRVSVVLTLTVLLMHLLRHLMRQLLHLLPLKGLLQLLS